MISYISRRFVQAFFTVFGVMLLTFILFRVIAGDVSTAYVNQKLGMEARQAFYEKHKLDRPSVLNFHKRLILKDKTSGQHGFKAQDIDKSRIITALNIQLALPLNGAHDKKDISSIMESRFIFNLSNATPLKSMSNGKPLVAKQLKPGDECEMKFLLSDSTTLIAKIGGDKTCHDLISSINSCPGNDGKLVASISNWKIVDLFNAQFFWHLWENITFQGKSYATNQSLLEIIGQRAKYSLSITVPAMVLTWIFGLIISCFVAYFHGSWIDRFGVLLTVLGMCVPYLAYMLIGQWIMFKIAPEYAAGLFHPSSIYVPVFIAVVAGLGSEVRFYRTIILNEITKDYIRTARAKGVPLTTILFVHVLKNCMLPILTDLVSTLPFLIMGALLLERFFGIPGLGDLLLTSITSRDVPIITGLTFLTAIFYVISLIITDILYAVFDPRIRLQ
jgi:peptide/nickel transport system permease protein